MSGTSTSGSNGTVVVSGPDIIQVSDFYVKAGILHPITVGAIAVIALFAYIRIGSNRSIAPITCFDWLITVALGSTLAGIVNGNSLTRGILALGMMLFFQHVISILSSRCGYRMSWLVQGPPLIIVFRGEMLQKVMRDHRISSVDVYAALRSKGIFSVSQVECAVIEPNGSFSIFCKKDLEESGVEPESLIIIDGYRKLCKQYDENHPEERMENGTATDGDRKRRNTDMSASSGS